MRSCQLSVKALANKYDFKRFLNEYRLSQVVVFLFVWDMKTLKLSKEDALVCSKWRRLIRGTEEASDDSGGQCVRLFLVPAHPGYPELKGHKTVVVVLFVCVFVFFRN